MCRLCVGSHSLDLKRHIGRSNSKEVSGLFCYQYTSTFLHYDICVYIAMASDKVNCFISDNPLLENETNVEK